MTSAANDIHSGKTIFGLSFILNRTQVQAQPLINSLVFSTMIYEHAFVIGIIRLNLVSLLRSKFLYNFYVYSELLCFFFIPEKIVSTTSLKI